MRTNVPHIFAIGDLVGQPMLAHKAVHEGHVAAEAAAGQKSHFDVKVIPSVAYTDPEVAWAGITEDEAKAKGIKVEKGHFPWAASGRAVANGRAEGFTKLLFDAETHRIIGGTIVGTHAGDMIGEIALAIEMGCDGTDIGKTIHPHPTLGESIGMAPKCTKASAPTCRQAQAHAVRSKLESRDALPAFLFWGQVGRWRRVRLMCPLARPDTCTLPDLTQALLSRQAVQQQGGADGGPFDRADFQLFVRRVGAAASGTQTVEAVEHGGDELDIAGATLTGREGGDFAESCIGAGLRIDFQQGQIAGCGCHRRIVLVNSMLALVPGRLAATIARILAWARSRCS
jgi:hypothetical protein